MATHKNYLATSFKIQEGQKMRVFRPARGKQYQDELRKLKEKDEQKFNALIQCETEIKQDPLRTDYLVPSRQFPKDKAILLYLTIIQSIHRKYQLNFWRKEACNLIAPF